jgi:hypothetical protein
MFDRSTNKQEKYYTRAECRQINISDENFGLIALLTLKHESFKPTAKRAKNYCYHVTQYPGIIMKILHSGFSTYSLIFN